MNYRFMLSALAASALLVLTFSLLQKPPPGSVDLSGTYDIGTLTPLERPPEYGSQLTISPSDFNGAQTGVPTSPTAQSLEVASEDHGKQPLIIDGLVRTSIITQPVDGRLPQFSKEGQVRFQAKLRQMREVAGLDEVWWLDDPSGPFDGPEDRPLEERCLLDGVGSAGPPALPARYNNIKRIVQTPDTVVIVNEMIHDARVIRLYDTHVPDSVRRWLGDSIGWWEGGTLVVETTNFRKENGLFMAGENLKVLERFTRIDEHQLLYEFEVEDYSTWLESWQGEYVWRATSERMYEYACHEGNYSLPGILKGARASEAESIEAAGSSAGSS